MSRPVDVLGLGAEGASGLSADSRSRLDAATFLAGGRRHLDLAGARQAERFPIADNVAALVDRLRGRGDEERCVVLASGDPMLHGIGQSLAVGLGRDQIRVEPAVSSMQLAFARAGLAWHDAAIASIHGRPTARALLPLLGRPKIGLFTQDGASPSAVAAFFLDRGLGDYSAWVGERLGSGEERVETSDLAGLLGRRFADLNFLILERHPRPGPVFDWMGGPTLAIPDGAFVQPDAGPILLTHQDVRSVTLSRFAGVPDGPIWDIGAGLGGVAIDLARTFRGVEVVGVERSGTQVRFLRENRERFGAYNLRIIAGEAPDCLGSEEGPAGIFLGGSGGRLDAILDLAFDRLLPGGKLVANFVSLENLARFSNRTRLRGWPIDVTQVQVSHGRSLAGLTSLVPLRPVWIVRATRPLGKDRSGIESAAKPGKIPADPIRPDAGSQQRP